MGFVVVGLVILVLPIGWWLGIALSRRDHRKHPDLYPHVDWLGRHGRG